MEELKIVHEDEKGKITYLKIRKKAKISGNSASITLPKKMIGKLIEITFPVKQK